MNQAKNLIKTVEIMKKLKKDNLDTHHFEADVVEGKDVLDVRVEIGTVDVQVHELPKVVIDVAYREMDVTFEREGNRLVLEAEQSGNKLFKWRKHPKADVVVLIPAGCAVNVRVVTGKVNISDITAPVMSKLVTGNAQLTNLGDSIDVKVVTGNIRYEGILADAEHRFKAVTGNVRLALNKEPNVWFKAKTTTGRIRCDLPLHKETWNNGFVGQKVSGMLGSGAGKIQASLTTGNVHLTHATA